MKIILIHTLIALLSLSIGLYTISVIGVGFAFMNVNLMVFALFATFMSARERLKAEGIK